MIESSADILADFTLRLLDARTPPSAPLIIGLNGPQGCGKTTLANGLMGRLQSAGRTGLALSIDDFYLTRTEQVALAEGHSDNPYLQQRGYPGTHDIRLGVETLSALRDINSRRMPVRIPRYDKSAFAGRGDRLPESEWSVVSAPVDLVFFEGWMLGFTPVAEINIADRGLYEVNRRLAEYRLWLEYLDAFVIVEADEIHDVVDWRIEAEKNMRAQGKSGMPDNEVRSYIEKFIPAYELYLPPMLESPPVRSPLLRITIGKDRRPLRFSLT